MHLLLSLDAWPSKEVYLHQTSLPFLSPLLLLLPLVLPLSPHQPLIVLSLPRLLFLLLLLEHLLV